VIIQQSFQSFGEFGRLSFRLAGGDQFAQLPASSFKRHFGTPRNKYLDSQIGRPHQLGRGLAGNSNTRARLIS